MKNKLTAALSLLLVLCLGFGLASCAAKKTEYKLGLGSVTETAASKTGTAEVDATFAAVVLDQNGKITACRVDTAQSKLSVADGKLGEAPEFATKYEQGDSYNMKTYGGAIAEWYQQADSFCQFVVGKTPEEAAGITGAESDLVSGCTIDVSGFVAALVKACEDAGTRTFQTSDPIRLGLSIRTALDGTSVSASAGQDGSANLYSDAAAVVTDAKGATLAAAVDSIQPKVTFDASGAITGSSAPASKAEQGDSYGMVAYGGAKAEWYKQAAAFETFLAGKTAEQILGITGAESDLVSGCTIEVAGLQAAAAKAAKYAADAE